VRRAAQQVELGSVVLVAALERDDLAARGHVEAVRLAQLVRFAVHLDHARAADVDDPEFAALEEIVGAGLLVVLESDRRRAGAHAARGHAIEVGEREGDAVGGEEVLDEEVAAQRVG
jgi:hypothetical protein